MTDELPYCPCCGKLKKDIQNELYKIPYKKNKRQLGPHFQYKGKSYFYDDSRLRNCENCGKKLTEEEVYVEPEFMGMCGNSRAIEDILVGYKCDSCSHVEDY